MPSEISAGTARKPVGRPFPKGVSGNPGGRPAGLGSYIREKTDDCREVADFFLAVMRGAALVHEDGEVDFPAIRERMEAGKWLGDRGAGKVAEVERDDFEHLTDDELISMLTAALNKRAQAAPSPEVSQ